MELTWIQPQQKGMSLPGHNTGTTAIFHMVDPSHMVTPYQTTALSLRIAIFHTTLSTSFHTILHTTAASQTMVPAQTREELMQIEEHSWRTLQVLINSRT